MRAAITLFSGILLGPGCGGYDGGEAGAPPSGRPGYFEAAEPAPPSAPPPMGAFDPAYDAALADFSREIDELAARRGGLVEEETRPLLRTLAAVIAAVPDPGGIDVERAASEIRGSARGGPIFGIAPDSATRAALETTSMVLVSLARGPFRGAPGLLQASYEADGEIRGLRAPLAAASDRGGEPEVVLALRKVEQAFRKLRMAPKRPKPKTQPLPPHLVPLLE